MALPNSALIIDDEPHVRLFAAQLLRQTGVPAFHEAGDAEEGWRAFQQHRPGLVLIDLNLKGGGPSGLDLLRRIRQADAEVYLVMFTCDASSQTVMAAASAGADGFLRKDTPVAELQRQLTDILAEPEEDDAG